MQPRIDMQPRLAPLTLRLLALGVLGLVAAPTLALAQPTARELVEARAALRTYDTHTDATTDTIAALGRLARQAHGRDALEARFLRTVASADLLLIAQRRDDANLTARIATAFGCEPAALPAALRAELTQLRVAPFRETAEDVLAALSPEAHLRVPSTDAQHTRRQAVFFARVFERLLAQDDPSLVLSELASDPCADGADCPDVYRHFGPRGRRAIAGMSAIHGVLGALEDTARLGDPFSAALAREVLVDAVLLNDISLTPRDWAGAVTPVDVGTHGSVVDADAVIVLAPDHLRVGWVPRVEFEGGQPRAHADGAPLLADAASARFPIGGGSESSTRPLEGLAEHLASQLASARRVALVLEPGVPAHLLSRVLASLEAAHVEPIALAGADVDGTALGVAYRAVHGATEAPVGVFVRLGGFSAWQPGSPLVSLPRQRIDNRWRFDMVGLDRATALRADHPVTLRYMGTTSADLVLRVALLVASANHPVQIALP